MTTRGTEGDDPRGQGNRQDTAGISLTCSSAQRTGPQSVLGGPGSRISSVPAGVATW